MTDQPIGSIGVVGGGTMGAGIAQVAARHDLRVVLVEQSTERAEAARDRISADLTKLVDRGKIDPDARDRVIAHLTVTSDLADLAGVDIAIEAVFEDLSIKQDVARALGEILPVGALFASNTSSISIDRIADAFPRPEQVVGIHFFNPVPVLPLVEIVAGIRTSSAAVDQAEGLAVALGKTPIRVKDRPGFVVNRLLIPMINEAALLVGEEVADREAIDAAMRLGASHPLGPLSLADLIGLDVCLAIIETLSTDLDAARFAPAPILRSLVEQGHLGRKSGQGFFSYAD